MKYFLLLSLLLAFLTGYQHPSQSGADRTPDFKAIGAELEVLPAGDPGPRLALEGDDPSACDHGVVELVHFRPLLGLHLPHLIPVSTTTAYAIRAPPASTPT